MSGSAAHGQESDPISKADFARQIVKRSIKELAEQLEAGASAKLNAYLAAMSRFHHYSFGNIMLILSQRPEATRVAGFHTWRTLGRTVKRGEKGIAIFAPMRLKAKRDDRPSDDDSQNATFIRFRVVHVFDLSQTEGEPIPEPANVQGDPGAALLKLEDAVRAAGIALETSDNLDGAEGLSTGGKIIIKEGLPPAERFSVIVHEWAHEKLHRVDPADRPSKTVRELEAEAVAFVVNRSIGLNAGTASADYIRLYDGDSDKLAASLDRIQKTACSIIEAVNENDTAAQESTRRTRAVQVSNAKSSGR